MKRDGDVFGLFVEVERKLRGEIVLKASPSKDAVRLQREELHFEVYDRVGVASGKLAELLDRKGVQNYMVSVAGAIRTKGVNNRGKDWVIAIEDPSNEHAVGRNVIVPVCTKGQAISTAGSYRNFIAGKDGKTFSHIIDPTTGRPVDHKTVSVTVVGPSALWTDAIDTGLMVKGGEAALKYANERNIAIYVVTRNANDDGFETHYSRAMHRYLECE